MSVSLAVLDCLDSPTRCGPLGGLSDGSAFTSVPLDLWGVYGPSDDPRRLGRPLGAAQDAVAMAVLAEE